MDINEFNMLVERTMMEERAIRLARAVLVEGLGYTEVANRESANGRKCTTQTVYRAARRIKREKIKDEGVPTSWVCLTVVVPKEVSQRIRQLEIEQKKKIGLVVS